MPSPFDIIKFTTQSQLETANAFSKMISASYDAAAGGIREAASINNNIISSAINYKQTQVDEWWKQQQLEKQSQQLDLAQKTLALNTWAETQKVDFENKKLTEDLAFKQKAEDNKLAHYFLSDASSTLNRNLTGLKFEIQSDERSLTDQLAILKQANLIDPNDTTHSDVMNNIRTLQQNIEKKKLQFSQLSANYNKVTDAYQKVTMGVADGNDIIKSLPKDILAPIGTETSNQNQQNIDNKIITPSTSVQYGDEATGQETSSQIPVSKFQDRVLDPSTGKFKWNDVGLQNAIGAIDAKYKGAVPYDLVRNVISQSTPETQKKYQSAQQSFLTQAAFDFAKEYINPKEKSDVDRAAMLNEAAKLGISPSDINAVNQKVTYEIGPKIQDLNVEKQADRANQATRIIQESLFPKPTDNTPTDDKGRQQPTGASVNTSGGLILTEKGGVSGVTYIDPTQLQETAKLQASTETAQKRLDDIESKMFDKNNPNELSKSAVNILTQLPPSAFGIKTKSVAPSLAFITMNENVGVSDEEKKNVEKQKISIINDLIKNKKYNEIKSLLYRASIGEFGTG